MSSKVNISLARLELSLAQLKNSIEQADDTTALEHVTQLTHIIQQLRLELSTCTDWLNWPVGTAQHLSLQQALPRLTTVLERLAAATEKLNTSVLY